MKTILIILVFRVGNIEAVSTQTFDSFSECDNVRSVITEVMRQEQRKILARRHVLVCADLERTE